MQKIADRFLKHLEDIKHGQIALTTPDGQTRVFGSNDNGPAADIEIRDWRMIENLLVKGDQGFAEDYQAGLWDTKNLQNLMTVALMNDGVMDRYIYGNKLLQMGSRLMYLLRMNSKSGSKRNIQAHYDLGNDFYSLWLDRTMTYSSAIFQNPQETLEAAQTRKYDRLIDRMRKPSGSILEIGCGWGGFGEQALARGDYGIKGITLSEEQHRFAGQRLQNKATIALEDYRDQRGQFDHIVSIEMFEAVGERYWPTYFSKISQLLKSGGNALIQTITISDQYFERYRKSGDVIRSFVFPGGMLPSPERFEAEARKAGLVQADNFSFGQDYAETLERWLANFDANIAAVKAQGFSQEFIRLWRFYLAACIAGFRSGRTDVMQVELRHA